MLEIVKLSKKARTVVGSETFHSKYRKTKLLCQLALWEIIVGNMHLKKSITDF